MPTARETLESASHMNRVSGLPRRDFILLPVLSLATIIAMFAGAELGTRIFWPAQSDDSCSIRGALENKPNCTVTGKAAEGPLTTYHYNECGYRTYDSCGPKPPGAFRICVLGTSVSEGFNVPYDQTFTSRAAHEIGRAAGRTVQVENLAFENLSPLECYRRLPAALGLQPNLVIYAVSPFDLEQPIDPAQLADRNNPAASNAAPTTQFKDSWTGRLRQTLMNNSRAILIAQHFLFSNPETFLRVYLAHSDTGYLQQPADAAWRLRYSNFELIIGGMASRTRQRGVPLFIMAVPSRAQAALFSPDARLPHTDPFAFGASIRAICEKIGAVYVDSLEEFGQAAHAERLFYVVDSHVNSDGHALLSRALVHKALDGSIPSLITGGRRTN
jgi:hypothetical protein